MLKRRHGPAQTHGVAGVGRERGPLKLQRLLWAQDMIAIDSRMLILEYIDLVSNLAAGGLGSRCRPPRIRPPACRGMGPSSDRQGKSNG